MFIEMILRSSELRSRYDVLHLDTSDRRSLANLGRLDPTNVALALMHALQLAVLIARERPDVVYIGISQNRLAYLRDAVLIVIARAFGCRVASHLHGSGFQEFYAQSGRSMRALIRKTTSWLSAAAVLSESLRGMYAGLLPNDKVFVAGVGAPDPAEGQFVQRARRNVAMMTVGYLGVLYRPKGVLELLDAAALLVQRAVPVRFEFAGDWFSAEDRTAIRERMAQHGLQDHVQFVGHVTGETKRSFFERIDLLAFPGYQTEGLPLVILEAMAAQLPVVATSVGAIPDILADGETGIIVPPRDVAALAAAIEKLVVDRSSREQMGRKGRERYLAGYTERHSMQQLVRVFDRVSRITAA
jgi:glycosyltransferase involved in cell wall biosynthesis